MADARQFRLDIRRSGDISIREMPEVELDAILIAPVERNLVDAQRRFAAILRRGEMVGRIKMRAIVCGEFDFLHRPALAIRQVRRGQARKIGADDCGALLVIDVGDLRFAARRIGGNACAQSAGNINEAAGHVFLLRICICCNMLMSSSKSNAGSGMRFLLQAACAALMALTGAARADEVEDFYRGKTITALVGVSAGGEYDLQLRLVAKHLGRFIPGHPAIIAQNMVGATGLLMANHLYRVAPRDGSVIAVIQNGLPATQAVGAPGVQFDALKFNWIGAVSPVSEVMIASKASGVRNIEDARAREVIAGAIGSAGVTLAMPSMLNDVLGTRFRMVTGYTGSGNLDIAIERGEVFARANAWSSLRASHPDWIARGDITVLVHTGPRPADLPEAPSLESLVAPGADRAVVDIVTAGDRLGRPFATTPDVPAARVAALRTAFAAMLGDAEFIRDAGARKIEVDPVDALALQRAVAAALGASDAAKARAGKYFQ